REHFWTADSKRRTSQFFALHRRPDSEHIQSEAVQEQRCLRSHRINLAKHLALQQQQFCSCLNTYSPAFVGLRRGASGGCLSGVWTRNIVTSPTAAVTKKSHFSG